jgi:hypothetical protein
MAEHALEWEALNNKDLQRRWRTRCPGGGVREVLTLLRMVDQAGWVNGRSRAILFAHSRDECGFQSLESATGERDPAAGEGRVKTWWNSAWHFWPSPQERGAENPGRLVRARGRADGVVASYRWLFSRREPEDVQEIQPARSHALMRLRRDDCAKYLAHVVTTVNP